MELEVAVQAELADARFSTRTHGKASCYNAGCRGPLCTYSKRVQQRKIRKPRPQGGYAAMLDAALAPLLQQYERSRAS